MFRVHAFPLRKIKNYSGACPDSDMPRIIFIELVPALYMLPVFDRRNAAGSAP